MYCPFCIKNHPHKIFETKKEYVVYNKRPGENKGRCVIIPKRHITNVREFTDQEISSFFKTVQLVSKKLYLYLRPKGINYGFNEGKIAGKTMAHFHFHLIPRYKNDQLPKYHLLHRHPKSKKNLSDRELKPLIYEFKKLFN